MRKDFKKALKKVMAVNVVILFIFSINIIIQWRSKVVVDFIINYVFCIYAISQIWFAAKMYFKYGMEEREKPIDWVAIKKRHKKI